MGELGGFFAGSIFAKLALDKTGWNQAVKEVAKDQEGLTDAFRKTAGPAKDLIGLLDKYRITTAAEAAKITKQLEAELRLLGEAFGKGEITMGAYQKASKDINDQLNALKGTTEGVKTTQERLREALERTAKIGREAARVGKELALAGGVVTAAFGAMIIKTVNAGDGLNDLSKRTGVATEILSGYKLAADKSGTSLDGLAIGMRGLANQMKSANDGSKEAKRLFDSLGISYTDNEGKLRPLNDVMLDVADRFSRMEDGALKTALAQDVFGRSGMELIPLLNLGAEGLKKEREEAERLGIVFSSQSAQACDDFNDSLAGLKGALSGASKEIGMTLLPMVKSFVDRMTDVISGIRSWAEAHPGLTKAVSATGLALGGIATGAGTFIFVLGTLIAKLATLATAFNTTIGALSASIGIWSAATLAVGYYVAKLFELKSAIDKADEADKRFVETNINLGNKLYELVKNGDMAIDTYYKLWDQFDQNAVAMANFIREGKAGKQAQEGLVEIGKKHAAAIEEQKKKTKEFLPVIADAAKKQKTWGEYLQDYGVIPLKEKRAKIAELLGHEEKLNQMLKDGTIDSKEYADGIKTLNDKLKELGATTMTEVLPPSKDMSDIWKQAPGQMNDAAYAVGTLEDQMADYAADAGYSAATTNAFVYELQRMRLTAAGVYLPELDWGSVPKEAKGAVDTTKNYFDGLYNDIARGFGDVVSSIKITNEGLQVDFKALFSTIGDAFKTMIGEMAADWVLGKFKDLFSSIGKAATETMSSAASTAASAVGGITQGASQAIGGLWTGLGAAVGSFLGTALAGLIGGGPSGHAQQQQINDTKDIRNKAFDIHNWLMSYGLNIEKHIVEIRNERFDTIYTKFDGLKGSVDLTRSTLAGLLQEISKKLSSTPSAQHGAIVTATGLVRVHGTPTRPEFIIPAPNLQRMAANLRPASREGRTSVINITNEVHIDGQVVTTREYAREQLLPEIVQALKAGIRKSDLQAALGLS